VFVAKLTLLTTAFFVQIASASVAGNKYSDESTGFSIEKPADWIFNKKQKSYGIQLNTEKMTSAEAGILVSFTKKMPAGFQGVKPSVGVKILDKVNSRTNLQQWLANELKSQEAHDKFFMPGSPATASSIDGVTGAAQAAYVNSTVIDGHEFHVYHVLYVVPAGKKTFLVNMNCNDDLANTYVGVFAEIAGSIRVDKP